MNMREQLNRIPRWTWALIAISISFVIVYGTQRIFIKPVFHAHSALDYWNLRWMRTSEEFPPEFFGNTRGQWLWWDTFIFLMSTLISALVASFIVQMGVKKIRMPFGISLSVVIISVLPSLVVFIQTGENGQLPLHLLACFTTHRYELATWTFISAIGGVVLLFLVKVLLVWREKRRESDADGMKKENLSTQKDSP